MTKKAVLLVALICCLGSGRAQLADQLRLGVEAGFIGFNKSEKLSFLINMEPKLRSSNNSFIGLRFSVAVNSQTIENRDDAAYIVDDRYDHGFFSLVPTFGYYWGDEDFRPFAGIGAGPYLLGNRFDLKPVSPAPAFGEKLEAEPGIKLGFLVRAGFEIRRLRFGAEYNYIPPAEVRIVGDQVAATIKSSYFGGTVGYVFGGG